MKYSLDDLDPRPLGLNSLYNVYQRPNTNEREITRPSRTRLLLGCTCDRPSQEEQVQGVLLEVQQGHLLVFPLLRQIVVVLSEWRAGCLQY